MDVKASDGSNLSSKECQGIHDQMGAARSLAPMSHTRWVQKVGYQKEKAYTSIPEPLKHITGAKAKIHSWGRQNSWLPQDADTLEWMILSSMRWGVGQSTQSSPPDLKKNRKK